MRCRNNTEETTKPTKIILLKGEWGPILCLFAGFCVAFHTRLIIQEANVLLVFFKQTNNIFDLFTLSDFTPERCHPKVPYVKAEERLTNTSNDIGYN